MKPVPSMIRVEHLTRTFGLFGAVSEISFEIALSARIQLQGGGVSGSVSGTFQKSLCAPGLFLAFSKTRIESNRRT